ncbi:MAG: hypothetical protein Q7R95_06090 [bacterium]|nr:hypothetical protein [bacterium]
MIKNLHELKGYELWKIEIPTSIESWTEYIVAKDDEEAILAQKLMGRKEYKLQRISWGSLDKIYIFRDEK